MQPDLLYFFNSSETGRLARSIDWSQHSLGPAEDWPHSLKTVLGILFRSSQPMFLYWGPDLICFYNDALIPNFRLDRHPKTMGIKGVDSMPDIWPLIYPRIEKVIKTGVGNSYVNHMIPILKNGTIENVYWTYHYSPILDDAGQTAGILVTCTETTPAVIAEQGLRENEERLSLALISGDIGFWEWSTKTGQLSLSETMMHDWGINPMTFHQTQDEVLERVHPDDREASLLAIQKAVNEHRLYDLEHRVLRPSGEEIWVHVKARCHYDAQGKPERLTGISINITDQKNASKALSEAKSAADRANQIKSDFLANMSHEIRTPLGAILGFTELLHDENLPPSDRRQFLETISRNGITLTHVIDDILDLSKVEAGRLQIENIEFSFHQALVEVTNLLKESSSAKGLYLNLEITPNTPEYLCSDPVRIRQILTNLIGNAIKFTSSGGITVRASASSNDGKHYFIKIEIADTGIGITPEQQSRLFEPFTQADSSTNRQFGGTGLGLALSRKLARLLKGEVGILHSSKEGTTFCMSFRAETPYSTCFLDPPSSEKKTYEDIQLKGLRILVADDSEDNRFFVKEVLERVGAKVELVDNGIEAVQLALSETFDVVLMDIQMPVMDGYEATKGLRRAGYQRPIIALTAHAMIEERERTRAAGCDVHLTKPLNIKDLIETIDSFCRQTAHQEGA